VRCRRIVASGGLSVIDLLLETQAAYLGRPIERCSRQETSAWGAAALAGVGAGIWKNIRDASGVAATTRTFQPSGSPREIDARRKGWNTVVQAARTLASQAGVNQS
jgi:glycerol kinase